MSFLRDVMRRMLRLIIRRSPPGSRDWGEAMLREMDVIDDDRRAMRWALGSTVALCRHAIVERVRGWRPRATSGESVRARRVRLTASIVSGIAAAAVTVSLSMMTLRALEQQAWMTTGEVHPLRLLFAVVIPDALCLVGAVALWRTHKRLICSIVAAGATLGAHSIIFFVA